MVANRNEAGSVPALTDPEIFKATSFASSDTVVGDTIPAHNTLDVSQDEINVGPDVFSGIAHEPDVGSINGENLFDRIHTYLARFVSYPSKTSSIAHVLWIAHTHLMEAWFTTPRLAVLSPEPGSGKSRVLELTAILVPRPVFSVTSSSAYVLRKIADQENRPTILYDEIDTVYGPQARGNEDLRGMINAGYRRGAKVGRCYTEKGKVFTEELATYAAIALGGLGDLPETIMNRSVVILMRKRASGEQVESFRPLLHEAEGIALKDELVLWAQTVFNMALAATPLMPEGIADRNEDIWRPLLTVAVLAGGRWPELATQAAVASVQAAKADIRPSQGAQLLADIRRCFGDDAAIPSKELVRRLLEDDEAPWGDIRGKRLDPLTLRNLLKPFGIHSRTIRVGDSTPKGYRRDEFHEHWQRYLPPVPVSETSATTATDATTR